MIMKTFKPNWTPLVKFRHQPFIKFTPGILGIPPLYTKPNYELITSYSDLPDDPYLNEYNITRQRRHANYTLKVRDTYTYDINGTTNYSGVLGKKIGIDGMREFAAYLRLQVAAGLDSSRTLAA